jgi:hypothetical protein
MINQKVNLDLNCQGEKQDPAYYILDRKVITSLRECVIESKDDEKVESKNNPPKSR